MHLHPVRNPGYATVRDSLFAVTGGTIARARRLSRGADRNWKLTVRPSGFGPVTLDLVPTTDCAGTPGVCDSLGRMLEGPLSLTVAGPPTLSVADAEVEEAAGATLEFAVTLSRALDEAVSADWATSDGTAAAGSDYTAASGTLSFAPGETEKTVSVAVLDDAHDEGAETLTLTLSNPAPARVKLADAEATGTIRNTDAMPQAWIARFGRTVAEQVLDAVEGRMRAPRQPGAEASLAGERIGLGPLFGADGDAGGREDAAARKKEEEERAAEAAARSLAEWLRGEADPEKTRTGWRGVDERELMLGSSFSLTAAAEGGPGGTVSLWGRSAVSRFDGREGGLTLDGEVVSGLIGADWSRAGPGGTTLGLIVGHSRGEGGYRSEAGGGTVASTLTGLYPWGRHALSERVSVWGVAGYGEGTLTLTPEGPDGESRAALGTGLGLMMGAVGLRGALLQAPEGGGPELAVKTDALGVRTTSAKTRGLAAADAEVTRLRLGLEGSWAVRFKGGGTLTPSVEIGVRHDGGDAETGFGADIGGGLAWSDPGRRLSAEVRGRGLLTHEAKGFRERGVSGTLSLDPSPGTGRGLSINLTRTMGGPSSGGADALLGRTTLDGLGAEPGGGPDARRFEARIGYGFAVLEDRYTATPRAGLGLTGASRELRLGWRLAERVPAGLAFEFGAEGTRREAAGGAAGAEHRIAVGAGWRLVDEGAGSFELRLEAARREAANDDAQPEHSLGARLVARW